MKVVIVAGGLGSRMGEMTKSLPKPMLLIKGKPILEHLISWLAASDLRDIALCLGYRSRPILDYFGIGEKWGVRLEYHVENEPRGTAGCVRDFACRFNEDILVVYGDLFVEMNIRPFLNFHGAQANSAASLILFKTDHPHDSDLVRLSGNKILEFYRDPQAQGRDFLSCAAIWAIKKPILDLIPADAPSDFGRDIFPKALKNNLNLSGYVTEELVADLGTMDRLAKFSEGKVS